MKKHLFLLVWSIIFTGSVAAYQEVSVRGGGSVSGTVFHHGRLPEPVVHKVRKHPDECGTGDRIFQEAAVKNGRLSNVIVYLSDIEKGKPYPVPEEGYSIRQEGCYFVPHLLVVKQKSKLEVLSKDSVGHNIHAYEVDGDRRRTIFNVAQPFADMVLKERVRVRRSRYVKVECDIHDFMHAWMFVAENPYFAVVNRDGTFKIDNIPPGRYIVKAWNPLLGELANSVEVSSDGHGLSNFTFGNAISGK